LALATLFRILFISVKADGDENSKENDEDDDDEKTHAIKRTITIPQQTLNAYGVS